MVVQHSLRLNCPQRKTYDKEFYSLMMYTVPLRIKMQDTIHSIVEQRVTYYLM